MKKLFAIICVFTMLFSLSAFADAEGNAVIEISSAKELAAIAEDLTADYVLTADIDLAGAEWAPIGSYAPSGESEEEQETRTEDRRRVKLIVVRPTVHTGERFK